MKKTEDANAQALLLLLRAAQVEVIEQRKILLSALSSKTLRHAPTSTVDVLTCVKKYGAAFLKLTSLEDQIDQDSKPLRNIVQGNADSIEDTRQEVTDRIARYRERSGN
ncbi:MAG: hypothetical protein QNK92_05130 [Amylibacter sp.]